MIQPVVDHLLRLINLLPDLAHLLQIMQQMLCNELVNEKGLLKTGNDSKFCFSHDNLSYYDVLQKENHEIDWY